MFRALRTAHLSHAGADSTERRVRERRREPLVLAVVVAMCLLLALAGAAVYAYLAPRPVSVGSHWVIGPGCSPEGSSTTSWDPLLPTAPAGRMGVFVFEPSGSIAIINRYHYSGGGGDNRWSVGGMWQWQFAGLTVLGP